jgi:membrane glycosyltransferase
VPRLPGHRDDDQGQEDVTSRFAQYLRLAGLPEPEVDAVGAGITNWTHLHAWLDRRRLAPVQPPPRRTPIVAAPMTVAWKANLREKLRGRVEDARAARPGWEALVEYRRRVSLSLTTATTAAMLFLSALLLRAQQMPETTFYIYLAIYGLMTFFLASNFYKMVLGTWHVTRDTTANPWHPAATATDPRPGTRIAILFPVYHEDVARVAAGMAATWESIYETDPALAGRFDSFLLSDSRKLEYWIAEEAAVHALAEGCPEGRFYYRRRPVNANAKLGNVEDFCRRWGRDYDYMLVMDADSVMDGPAVIALLRMMEGNPRLGILQTNPKPILRTSLFGRMQQFSARLYGSVFSWGLQAIFMGHASYIGHNAMIRVKAFAEHCFLPVLSGPKPWGGKPFSHDIVESAMMARAGYEVWFLPDIEGSYEEMPANILGFFMRERRWMQGNLQHLRFLFLKGLRPTYRETFLNGSLGYVSAPLWAMFLLVSAYGMIHFLHHGVLAFGSLRAIELPMTMLLVSSLVFLFLPRLLALAVHLRHDKAKTFGGKDKLVISVLLETLFSFFFSPLMMAYITRFFWLWLKRRGISWGTQDRGDAPLSWDTCLRFFGWISLVGIACWTALAWAIAQTPESQVLLLEVASDGWVRPGDALLWFFPILGGFSFSIWIARYTSLTFPWLLRRRLFAIPEEIRPPRVIGAVIAWEHRLAAILPPTERRADAMRQVLADPGFYVRHRQGTRLRPEVAGRLLPKILSGQHLSERELFAAFGERRCFDALHAFNAGRGRPAAQARPA